MNYEAGLKTKWEFIVLFFVCIDDGRIKLWQCGKENRRIRLQNIV